LDKYTPNYLENISQIQEAAMYEKHFEEFLAFLFPNEYFPDESILLFVFLYAGEELSIEKLDEYQDVHGIELSEEAITAITIFVEILNEMKKTKPDIGLIEFCVDQLVWILGILGTENVERYRTLNDLFSKDEFSS